MYNIIFYEKVMLFKFLKIPYFPCSAVGSANGHFFFASYILYMGITFFHGFFDTYSTYKNIQHDIKATGKDLKEI